MSNNPTINNALFQFCQMADDGPRTAPSADRPQRSAEDLQWLREAIQSVEAPERTVKRLLTSIVDATDATDELLADMEELSDTVEDMNWAIEFSLMKGHVVVLKALEKPFVSKSSDSRRLLAMIIAHAAQQNDQVQQRFNEAKWADVLVPLVAQEEDPQVLAALLHACSCMCRECDEGSKAFITSGGLRVLEALLEASDSAKATDKVVQRTLFLVQYFAVVGVSSERLLTATSARLTAAASSGEVATSAASALHATYKRCPDLVKPILKPLLSEEFASSLMGLDASDPRVALKLAILGDT
jgi:hypothetical protein